MARVLVLVTCLFAVGVAYAEDTITVGPSGCDHTSIQAAINAASPGDTIEVYSGTYHESVDVNKQLILQGIDTSDGLPVVNTDYSGSAITLSVDGIILDGFCTINALGGFETAGIKVISNNNTILNNSANNNYIGIYLTGSKNNNITGNIANYNDFGGIAIYYSSNNNSLLGNTANHNGQCGIRIYHSFNNAITNSTTEGNTQHGINLGYSRNNRIISNTAVNNGIGITLSISKNNTIVGNIARGSRIYGISLQDSDNNIIYNNVFIDNGANDVRGSGNNQWDNGTLGNYYSEFDCKDVNECGICNLPYNIPLSCGSDCPGVDRYPLTSPHPVL